MSVTVVIAAYNAEQTIGAAIESALSQTLAANEFEVIVVDDGSTDATASIVRRFGSPVRLIEAPHRGLAATCNAGLNEALGERFIRLDADDALDPDCLLILERVMSVNPSVGCAFGDRLETFPDGRRVRVDLEPFDLLKMIACGTMFRTALAREAGGYDDLLFEEYDFLLRYLQRAPRTFHVPVPLYTYTRHDAGMTAQPDYWRDGWNQLVAKWGIDRLHALGCDEARLP
jgi:glycosyltransferase involved in cell wall biosynthesis